MSMKPIDKMPKSATPTTGGCSCCPPTAAAPNARTNHTGNARKFLHLLLSLLIRAFKSLLLFIFNARVKSNYYIIVLPFLSSIFYIIYLYSIYFKIWYFSYKKKEVFIVRACLKQVAAQHRGDHSGWP